MKGRGWKNKKLEGERKVDCHKQTAQTRGSNCFRTTKTRGVTWTHRWPLEGNCYCWCNGFSSNGGSNSGADGQLAGQPVWLTCGGHNFRLKRIDWSAIRSKTKLPEFIMSSLLLFLSSVAQSLTWIRNSSSRRWKRGKLSHFYWEKFPSPSLGATNYCYCRRRRRRRRR